MKDCLVKQQIINEYITYLKHFSHKTNIPQYNEKFDKLRKREKIRELNKINTQVREDAKLYEHEEDVIKFEEKYLIDKPTVQLAEDFHRKIKYVDPGYALVSSRELCKERANS